MFRVLALGYGTHTRIFDSCTVHRADKRYVLSTINTALSYLRTTDRLDRGLYDIRYLSDFAFPEVKPSKRRNGVNRRAQVKRKCCLCICKWIFDKDLVQYLPYPPKTKFHDRTNNYCVIGVNVSWCSRAICLVSKPYWFGVESEIVTSLPPTTR